jgi:endonuclease YncB( thermonuclease family)
MTDAQLPARNWSYTLSALTFFLLVSPAHADPVHIIGIPGATDGDTLRIEDQPIRLFGIDSPERHQSCSNSDGQAYACGQVATRALADFIAGRQVDCEVRDVDRYGRSVAACMVGDVDLGGWMVKNGWTVAYRKYSVDYIAAEDAARSAKVGLWSGSFEWPWDWRKAN